MSSDYDPNADFASLRSYAWLPGVREKTGDPRIDNSLVATRIERAVDNALAAKGFPRVAVESADFFVTFYIGIDNKLDISTIPTTYGYYGRWGGFYSGTETLVEQYEEGTLLIDFIDRDRDDLLWRGTGQSRLRQSKTPEERDRKAQAAVDAILQQFPPRR